MNISFRSITSLESASWQSVDRNRILIIDLIVFSENGAQQDWQLKGI